MLEVRNDGAHLHNGGRGGVGLRLATLEALQYGGVLEYGESEPGRLAGAPGGAHRPVSTPAADASRRASAARRRRQKRLRVLVVDDHDVVHWGFRLMLGQMPWVERCLSARTGAEAVAVCRRYEPHVALVDLFLGERVRARRSASACARRRRPRACS